MSPRGDLPRDRQLVELAQQRVRQLTRRRKLQRQVDVLDAEIHTTHNLLRLMMAPESFAPDVVVDLLADAPAEPGAAGGSSSC